MAGNFLGSYSIIALQERPCFNELVSSFVGNEFLLQRKLANAVRICTALPNISAIPRKATLGSCTVLRNVLYCVLYCIVLRIVVR
jgi:hypothetical protein